MSVADKLKIIAENQQAIYEKGKQDGGGSGGDTLKTLLDATKSTRSYFGGYLGTSVDGIIPYNSTENVTNMSSMFHYCASLTSVPLFDTSKVTNMASMFSNCSNLTSVPLFDTSNVTNMTYMFNGCSNLTSVPLFDTSKVTNMDSMFNGCSNLTSVSLFDTSNVTNMPYMFSNCKSLTKVKLQGVSEKLTTTSQWFYYCKSLELIDFRGATGVPKLSSINAFSEVPATCKVVIPDALYDTWVNATNWSAINVVYVKESEYVEA